MLALAETDCRSAIACFALRNNRQALWFQRRRLLPQRDAAKPAERSAINGSEMATEKPGLDRHSFHLMQRLWREMMLPHRGRLMLAAFFMSIVAGATAVTAWLIDPVINELFVEKDTETLVWISIAVFVTFLARSVATYAQEVLIAFTGQRVIADMQVRLFRHLLHQDVATLQDNNSAMLLSRFTYDINMMRFAVSSAVVAIGRDVLSIIFLVGLMFYQEWLLATIAFLVAPASAYPIQLLGKRIRSMTRSNQEQMGLFAQQLAQSFQGIRTVKIFQMEQQEEKRAGTVVDRIFSLSYRAARASAATQPTIDLFGGIAIAAVILYGGSRVISGESTAGGFFSFIAALMMAYQPMRALGKVNARIQEGLAAADRVFQLMDQAPSIVDRPAAAQLPLKAGSVCLKSVSLRYANEAVALNEVTLQAPAGKTTALVGPSGAGKSSILNLIPRFYDPDAGEVVISDHNARDVTLSSLRRSLSLVSQEVVLFDDSVANNIRYGRAGASDEEVRAAAAAAAAHEFITALPNGYETAIGEQGLKLSGGQRQRVAIARAILKDAPILLLDEATSALDTESERQIQAALEKLMQGRTTIVIAHRLSTVVNADVIHVLDKGRLVQSGTHQELLAQGGLYGHLHELQFQSADDAVGDADEPGRNPV